MRILLDTHVVIWWDEGARLARTADRAIRDAEQVYVSAVSGWEIAVKSSLGRLATRRQLGDVVRESGFEELPIRLHHAHELAALPWHHRDPFDRMLLAQSRAERLILVSRDPVFAKYGIRTIAA